MWDALRRFSWFGREYVLAPWPHPVDDVVSALEARAVVRAAADDFFGRMALCDALASCGFVSFDLDDVAGAALRALDDGMLRVGALPVIELPPLPSAGALDTDLDDHDPGGPDAERAHWIEIELVDPDGRPVPRERFELVAKDGRRRGGTLDELGFARVEALDDTDYEIVFPNLTASGCTRV